MSDTDDMIIRLNEEAAVMLKWANRYRMLQMNAMQSVFQRAAETLMDAGEHLRLVDDQRLRADRGLGVYRVVADQLSKEIEHAEKRSITYNVIRFGRLIRNFYR